MKKIELTEAQAWETLARFFMKIKSPEQAEAAHGICHQLFELRDYCKGYYISSETFHAMFRVMLRTVGKAGYVYYFLWPVTVKGAKRKSEIL